MSTQPPSDEQDRDALDSSDSLETDEYELEPLDDTVLSVEQRHMQSILESSAQHVDIEQIMREEEQRLDVHILDGLKQDLRLKFQIKHLLWVTAIVAILVSAAHYNFWASALLAVLVTVASLLAYLTQKELQHQAALQERLRQHRARLKAGHTASARPAAPTPAEAPVEPLAKTLANFCSLRELLMAVAFALVFLAVLGSMYGAAITAASLGLVALGGIFLQVVGIELPRIVALVWWVLMVVYVVICIFLAVSARFVEQVAQ